MINELNEREMLDLLIEKAPALREAGIYHLTFGGVEVQMQPHVEDREVGGTGDYVDETFSDPVMDPRTYQGGRRPDFRKPPTGEY